MARVKWMKTLWVLSCLAGKYVHMESAAKLEMSKDKLFKCTIKL